MSFIELRTHTAFSFGDGVLSPESLVSRAASMGYRALGLTDHADLGGAIRFTLAAESAGLKPIVGAELEVDGHPVAFLARDGVGYRNLSTLVTQSRMGELGRWGPPAAAPTTTGRRGHVLDRRYAVPLPDRGRPVLTFSDVADRSEGLWCLTGPPWDPLESTCRHASLSIL